MTQGYASSYPEWSASAVVPTEGRSNPYGLSAQNFLREQHNGKIHTLHYPVSVTGMLIPIEPVKTVLDDSDHNPLRQIVRMLLGRLFSIHTTDELLESLGLHTYPELSDQGVYSVPYPDGHRPLERMGYGEVERYGSRGFTLSCATCHSGELFGKKVLGLTNRFSRANEFFVKGITLTRHVSMRVFQKTASANSGDLLIYRDLKASIKRAVAKKPSQLGLDTALAQVALSLAKQSRELDILEDFVADSKPMVWWNVKYKNRFLSDGSLVSGNPILTNILWNEIGRGGDLSLLKDWVEQNKEVIEALTTAVFSSEAPRYEDFFSDRPINVIQAKSGEIIFNQKCSKCHGTYEKAWSDPSVSSQNWIDEIQTTRVQYFENTPVKQVGTDPNRYLGMYSLESRLNPLSISRENSIVIEAQNGYVPPPLVGIWARWPYFHNNSVPNLCGVLDSESERPRVYYAGPAKNRFRDFDVNCVGYPLGKDTPAEWKKNKTYRYDTALSGHRNTGHDWFKLSRTEKYEVIEFLKTL